MADERKLAAWANAEAKEPPRAKRAPLTDEQEDELLSGDLGDQAGDLMYAMVDHLDDIARAIQGEALDLDVLDELKKYAAGLEMIHFETIVDTLFNGGGGLDPVEDSYMRDNPIFANETKMQDIIDWLADLAGDD